MFFQIFDQGGDPGGSFGVGSGSGIFGFVDETAGCGNQIFGPQSLVDGVEAVGRADHLGGVVAGGSDVIGPGLERGLEGGIGVGVFQKKDAAAAEHPGNGVRAAEVAAVFGEEVTNFGRRTVFVVGLGLDHEGGAAGGIAFVGDFLDGAAAFEFPGAFFDGAVDVVDGHGFGPCGRDGGAKARVEVGVAAGKAGGHGDFLGEFGKEGPAFDVGGALGAFDFGPMTVAGHSSSLNGKGSTCREGEDGIPKMGEGAGFNMFGWAN